MGKPSGPLFYISNQDNTNFNGPGRFDENGNPVDAGPCFGFISAGADTIELLMSLPGEGDDNYVGNAKIVSLEIMNIQQARSHLQLSD